MIATLGDVLDHRDAASFFGREAELRQLAALFDDESALRVVHVRGPGGIGKSALLREAARIGRARGWTPRVIEGRDLAPVPELLAAALSGIDAEERPLLLVDTYERISGLDGLLRREILPALPASARVIFAGRRPPDVGWSQGDWDAITAILGLGALPDAAARELLHGCGVEGTAVDGLVAWAAGSPLALRLAANGSAARAVPGAHADLESSETVIELVRRLTDTELDPAHLDVLAVASLARVTTAPLLRDVLGAEDADAALEWLAGRSFAEPLGGGLTLHDLVRRAARAALRRRDPERERVLRRRIADHLHARALEGDVLLSIDLSHLVEDPVLSWGYSWNGADRYRVDDVRPGDLERAGVLLARHGHAEVWRQAQEMAQAAPARVAVARNTDDELCGFTIAMTPANAPALAWEHPHVGPQLRHAIRLDSGGNAVVWQASIDLSGDRSARVQAMLGMAGILRSGLQNPRYAYMPVNRAVPGAVEFSRAVGARHLPELDVDIGEQRIECHLLDYGAGGVLGMQRDVVYRETGGTPPGSVNRDALAEQVREALRQFAVPHELARSPLAHGATPAERVAAHVRDAAG